MREYPNSLSLSIALLIGHEGLFMGSNYKTMGLFKRDTQKNIGLTIEIPQSFRGMQIACQNNILNTIDGSLTFNRLLGDSLRWEKIH